LDAFAPKRILDPVSGRNRKVVGRGKKERKKEKRNFDKFKNQSVPALYLFTHSPIDLSRGMTLCCA